MGTLQDIGQKVKGEAQKAQGEFQQATGHTVRGTISKVKGNVNSGMADAKLKTRTEADEDEM